ncbi:MAG: hypothetical protein JF611_05320 [Betaproteobacteria bacterium]|nr:hypothetical protein [Betaproteobacteria bacterium]
MSQPSKNPDRRGDEPLAFGERAKRVLIADDNRDWADGLAVLLEEEGYTVHTTYDGREGRSSSPSPPGPESRASCARR